MIRCKILKIFMNINKRSMGNIREIDYKEMNRIIRNNKDIKIIDVRSNQEYMERRINNAINIPLYELNKRIENEIEDKNCLIILYCGCGIRSKKAYRILEKKGYTNLYSLKDGIDEIF